MRFRVLPASALVLGLLIAASLALGADALPGPLQTSDPWMALIGAFPSTGALLWVMKMNADERKAINDTHAEELKSVRAAHADNLALLMKWTTDRMAGRPR